MSKKHHQPGSAQQTDESRENLSPKQLFGIIRENGIEELNRPAKALIFSAFTAGIVISFSFVFKAVLKAYLPGAEWSFLIESMGYTVGFILVILGHMQLFTENTITTVVPLLSPFSYKNLCKVIRLWSIVFLFNIIGTAVAAAFLLNHHLFDDNIIRELDAIAAHVSEADAVQNIIKGIPAGILITALVWVLPVVSNRLLVIFFVTYLMAIGGFSHVIVGSAESAYWYFKGHIDLIDYFFVFLLPTAFGNILGGTVIFTLLIYGQVNEEIESDRKPSK